MRMWARNTGRAALVAAGAVALGAAFGSAGVASAGTLYGDSGAMFGNARHGGDVDMTSSGNFGVANGNQVYAPISIPIDVCGNAIAIAGVSRAQCKGGASVSSGGSHGGYRASGHRTHRGGWGGNGGGGGGGDVNLVSSGNFGILNGNQVYAPINVPISVCGNSVALFGAAGAQCKGGASVQRSAKKDVTLRTSDNYGLLNGNQVYIPINVPISVCGNSVALFGRAQAQCKGGASVREADDKLPTTLRTPPKKKHKADRPSKNRPAAGKKKLPSTLRGASSRLAAPTLDYRSAEGLPSVQGFLDTLKKAAPASVPGVNVQPGQIGPQLPANDGVPVKVGAPALS